MTPDDDRPESSCSGTPVPLAASGVGRVVACACGNVHLDVEYVTLRFAPEAFAELAAMLSHAQRMLAGQHPAPAASADMTALH